MHNWQFKCLCSSYETDELHYSSQEWFESGSAVPLPRNAEDLSSLVEEEIEKE